MYWVAGLAILSVIGILNPSKANESSPRPDQPIVNEAAAKEETKEPELPALMPGDVGTLETPGGKMTLAGKSLSDYHELEKLLGIDDKEGVAKMALDGKVYLLGNGTRIRYIERAGLMDSTARVRILAGELLGEEAWVARTFIKIPAKKASNAQG